MTEIHLLITITLIGYLSIVYLGTGLALREFKGIDLPLIGQIYEASLVKSSKPRRGKWVDFRGNRVCSVCKTVFTDEEWEMLGTFGKIPDRCPKCGSYNEVV